MPVVANVANAGRPDAVSATVLPSGSVAVSGTTLVVPSDTKRSPIGERTGGRLTFVTVMVIVWLAESAGLPLSWTVMTTFG